MKVKPDAFTREEKSWILYDWANSVYSTNMTAAIFPIYYATIAGDDGNKWWGIGVSAASLLIALLAPLLGSIGDVRGMKKRMLAAFLLLGVLFTAFTAFVRDWRWMLLGYMLSHIGFSGANVFYDAFLPDVTSRERMDKVSAWGYAMGYLGGSTIPFVLSVIALLITGFGEAAVKFSILLTSVWWALFSLPLLVHVRQTHYTEDPPSRLAADTGKKLKATLSRIRANRGLACFLLAYFFYIDGVNTVISLATNYGATLGLGSTGMILALLVTQLVAVPCSLLFSRLSRRVPYHSSYQRRHRGICAHLRRGLLYGAQRGTLPDGLYRCCPRGGRTRRSRLRRGQGRYTADPPGYTRRGQGCARSPGSGGGFLLRRRRRAGKRGNRRCAHPYPGRKQIRLPGRQRPFRPPSGKYRP